ncbi:unnamed protein product [Rotaria sordida]|uniref:Uncharacterized protein n=2 Tax=Rotaria sordida TaxID=392033 RepID=A0A819C1D3_9BILA|nr:unnamed protein product [Rotaria sordida]
MSEKTKKSDFLHWKGLDFIVFYLIVYKAVHHNLALVTSNVQDDKKTAEVINYWFDLTIQGFKAAGFHPNRTVSYLPSSVELDDRFASVRNFRIDDVLKGTITEYDILRTLPYQNRLYSLAVPDKILARVLTDSISFKGNGIFLSYTRVEMIDQEKTWLINGQDISKTGLDYTVVTMDYAKKK